MAEMVRMAYKTTGQCAFYGTYGQVKPLEEYLRRLQRRYGGHILVNDSSFYEVRYVA